MKLEWASRDIERAAYNIRIFFMSLLDLKRNSKPAPRKFPELQIVIDKILINGDEEDAKGGDGAPP